MTDPFQRSRPETCLSDFALDQLLDPEAESAHARAHLSSCDDCARRLDELRAERDRFLEIAPPLSVEKKVVPLRSRRVIPVAIGLAMAAASILFVLQSPSDDPALGVQTKGGPSISFYVKHGDYVRPGSDGEVVSPGDALRFVYDAEQDYSLAILSIDPKRIISVYYPTAGEATVPASAGRKVAIAASTILDDSVGPESIFGFFCSTEVKLKTLEKTLQRGGAPSVNGCRVSSLTIRKELR